MNKAWILFVALMTFFVSCDKEITVERLDGTIWEGDASSTVSGLGGANSVGIAFHGDSTAFLLLYLDGQLVGGSVVNYELKYPDILFQKREGRHVYYVEEGSFVDSKTLSLRISSTTLSKKNRKLKSIGAKGLVGTHWEFREPEGEGATLFFQSSTSGKFCELNHHGEVDEEEDFNYSFDGVIGYFTLLSDHIDFGIIDGKLVADGGVFNKIK